MLIRPWCTLTLSFSLDFSTFRETCRRLLLTSCWPLTFLPTSPLQGHHAQNKMKFLQISSSVQCASEMEPVLQNDLSLKSPIQPNLGNLKPSPGWQSIGINMQTNCQESSNLHLDWRQGEEIAFLLSSQFHKLLISEMVPEGNFLGSPHSCLGRFTSEIMLLQLSMWHEKGLEKAQAAPVKHAVCSKENNSTIKRNVLRSLGYRFTLKAQDVDAFPFS